MAPHTGAQPPRGSTALVYAVAIRERVRGERRPSRGRTETNARCRARSKARASRSPKWIQT